MSTINDPDAVAQEYASELRLQARGSAYDTATGLNPNDLIVDLLSSWRPAAVLEVGHGAAALATRLQHVLGTRLTGIDISPRMVELAQAAGIGSQVGDLQALPFADASFDCAIAAWMLYHVPDVDLGIAELKRVLRPGGRLVAVTNGIGHMAEVWKLIGVERQASQMLSVFSSESGSVALARHFETVERIDIEGTVTFPDRDAVGRYLEASRQITGGNASTKIAAFDGPFVATRRNTVFIAVKEP